MNVLRWVLLVPAVVAGVLVGALSTALGTLATGFLLGLPNSGGWGIVLTLMLIFPAIGFIFGCFVAGGAIPVVAAAFTAPQHRGVVAIVVATLAVALIVIGTLSNIAGGVTVWSAVLVAILNIGGAIYAAAQARGSGAIPQPVPGGAVV